MAIKEEQEILRLLVQHVSRAFYEPKYTIIMDQLARHPVLKDDDLAGRMGLQSKELNKLIAVLSNDSLVKVYRQNELKEGAQRSVGKQYYYIDYEHFCNVVKWRIAKMRHKIDSSLRNELDNKGYICPQCKQSYTPLEVDRLMDFARGVLVCEICHAEVVDNENAESVQGSKDRMQRFNNQMRFIREGLQKSEKMILPAFDVAAWVKNHHNESAQLKIGQPGSGLKVAGSEPSKNEDTGVGVVMAMDKDETTQKRERDGAAEAKRQQNMLPSWHLQSTITGELTALGVKESTRQANNASAAASSNDDILRGLGVIRAKAAHTPAVVVEESEPVVSHESDYYDLYYASLVASSVPSTQATPTGLSGSDLDDSVGEEDRKPTIDYVDSLNDYRKRSRSAEDEGLKAAKATKVSKPPSLCGYDLESTKINGYSQEGGIEVNGDAVVVEDHTYPLENDPIVYVNGVAKEYSRITEVDHDLMTPDEYTAFFELFQAQSWEKF